MGLSSHISSSSSSSLDSCECCLCFPWVLFFSFVSFFGGEGSGGGCLCVEGMSCAVCIAELQHLLLY